ncbi:MAG TPA: MFS transporter, partial [Verrucomicrobiae bacterium]|nr:MFS transporter [Verrucomicrobiae bacterium]
LAWLAIVVTGRKALLRVFQIPGLILIPLVFLFPATNNLELFKWGIAIAGFFTIAQFSFWGNYLPRVYPVYLRGTGESFAANVGGRMIGTSGAFLTTNLALIMPGASNSTKLAYAAAAVALLVYAIGFITSCWLPEPKPEEPAE